ncbi:hypothetical protein BX600DRAFT_463053 [Xylariales sp. PMI_506]|nr:hypothetical protein BX600DRAFT_463053 [Xylariales sp. PMI_506]
MGTAACLPACLPLTTGMRCYYTPTELHNSDNHWLSTCIYAAHFAPHPEAIPAGMVTMCYNRLRGVCRNRILLFLARGRIICGSHSGALINHLSTNGYTS